ncbi:MAG: T9SS type A sorting domain-containing protein [Bacteroidales bacterium]|nr:T9SS type A sorting domain-containing protein [Bacteroidales bacterium]
MKRIFTLFAIIFAFNLLNAQETHRFRTDVPQGLNIENSTQTGLSLHYVLNEITIADHNNGDDKGQEIIMKGSFGSYAEGQPNLPFENLYIAVPRGAKVNVRVKENGCQTLNGIDLMPAAEVMLNRDAELPKLRKDMSVFGKDANFPAENVTIAQTTQIRGLDVVMLSVTPFRYNPVKKTLEVLYDMDIEVYFEGGNGQFGDARYRNPAWDGILRDLVINSDMLPEAHYYEHLNEAIQNREAGCEYLIITLDDSAFIAWADTLKRFRTKQGILTKVVTTADCGGNEPEDIRNYILNAYENWGIPPAAILLFGGNQVTHSDFGLKPFLFTSPPSYYTYTYPTDNPIADMNGDSIPDLAISRILAYDASDCQQQVEKLINYELDPPTDPHYYDHPVISSGYQKEKWFTISSQCFNSFVCNRLGKHPSNLYHKYYFEDHDPTPPDSIWSIADNTNAVLDYFGPNGTNYIPLSIGVLDNWQDQFDIQPLVDAMSEGSFLTFYRDHSSTDIWCCPWLEIRNLSLIKNEEPTFIFSIGCLNNDYWDNWSSPQCLSEAFLRAKTGAIGVIGANNVTYSQYNDLLAWGMFDYLWPDYMPTMGSQTVPDFAYPSYSLVAGKLFLRQQAFLPYTINAEKVEKTLNLFSYLGETYLNLYTEVPQPMTVEASPFHTNDQWQYTFTAEEGAKVCLSRNNEILYVIYASGQSQSLTIPQMEVGKQFILTATKQNRFRYEQAVTIIPAEQSFVYLKNTTLHDQDGNETLDYGEYASFNLDLDNAGRYASEGGQVTLLCESPYITLLQDAVSYPRIEPGNTVTLDNVFRIQIADDVPDQTPIRFGLRFNDGENTHTDYFEYLAHAPILQIEPEFSITDAEDNPSTHILTEGISLLSFTVKNNGSSKSQAVNAQVEIKAPFLTVEEPQLLSDGIEPNGSLRLTFPIKADGAEVLGAWPQIQLKFQHGDTELQIDTIIQYGGIFESFESDTLNQAYNWPPGPTEIWSFYSDAYQGRRCIRIALEDHYGYNFIATAKLPYQVHHACKTSFRYKTDRSDFFRIINNGNTIYLTASDTWAYMEALAPIRHQRFIWGLELTPEPVGDTLVAYIDDICFPPPHTTIAYSGDKMFSCGENPVKLSDAYAYDCNSIFWATEGDGHFDYDTIANPIYSPGNQDLTNGSVTLTLTAFGNDTIVSSAQVYFVDEISLGQITGDSVVNKYSNPVSHYAVERQDGIRYLWQLEPANAGYIYGYGNEVDILWNQHEDDMEATLTVTAENGCTTQPMTMHISLIGYSTSEWHSVDFDLFPNPTEGKINLVLSESLQGKAYIEVYNLLGERMMNKSIGYALKGETLSFDLSHLVSGLYIIKLSTENGSCTKKVSVW